MENKSKIIPIEISQEMKKSYIDYSMSVIVGRALPDVRDGLKPVHRRILYSMIEQGITPDKPYRKSARIVGDVLGKYHPHGDSSVYMAMVKMAQDFATRGLLVDGQGNFGNVDGDSPAAMRYTEARMSRLATELLRDIDKETVDFGPNFDESLQEPLVLPARYPNLLVNGSNGIAVGMATSIPPHNLGEVIDATVHYIDNRDCTTEDLMEHIAGPDFPTGAMIIGTEGIKEAYRTGRGKVRVRARAEIEELPKGKQQIVITEIPFQVNKSRLVERIADLVRDKKIEGISDLRDETNRHGIRVVIELKRDVNANIILNNLYKHSQLEETFSIINLAIVDKTPKVLNLKQYLECYVDHQKDVITRRTQFELKKAQARAHILEGLKIALDNIDRVISIIRGSENGQIAVGWKKINGNWYHLQADGRMTTGWLKEGSNWYYLKSSGEMQTGWLKDKGIWYYLESSGAMKTSQWFQVSGKHYYVNASGELAVNTTIDGFQVDADGVRVENPVS